MTRHLGMQVSAYVDRRLDPATLRAMDQHLVACQVCRHAADEERRLLTSLRCGAMPGVSADLQSMLLGLAAQPPRVAAGVPPIPTAPVGLRQVRLPTVAPAAPPLHRSPRRAALAAGLAAGASAAAAIGLAVVGPGPVSSASLREPVSRGPGATTATALRAAFLGSGLPSLVPGNESTPRSGR